MAKIPNLLWSKSFGSCEHVRSIPPLEHERFSITSLVTLVFVDALSNTLFLSPCFLCVCLFDDKAVCGWRVGVWTLKQTRENVNLFDFPQKCFWEQISSSLPRTYSTIQNNTKQTYRSCLVQKQLSSTVLSASGFCRLYLCMFSSYNTI